jgi:hypothetical protein
MLERRTRQAASAVLSPPEARRGKHPRLTHDAPAPRRRSARPARLRTLRLCWPPGRTTPWPAWRCEGRERACIEAGLPGGAPPVVPGVEGLGSGGAGRPEGARREAPPGWDRAAGLVGDLRGCSSLRRRASGKPHLCRPAPTSILSRTPPFTLPCPAARSNMPPSNHSPPPATPQRVIPRLVEESVGPRLYPKAMDCLARLRAACVALPRPRPFNELLAGVRGRPPRMPGAGTVLGEGRCTVPTPAAATHERTPGPACQTGGQALGSLCVRSCFEPLL